VQLQHIVKNRILGQLSADELKSVQPWLTLQELRSNVVLHERGDSVERVYFPLSPFTKELQDQLSRLGRATEFRKRGGESSLKGRKVAVKYRDRSGNTWAGRGAQPVWLRYKLKAGAKLEDFAVDKGVGSRKKSKKRRGAKR